MTSHRTSNIKNHTFSIEQKDEGVRIVAGKYRRRKLLSNPGSTTRPIMDRAKEILFERLQQDVGGRKIADIFAGTGTLGLEALSRGARSVVFVENDHRAFGLLQENVEKIVTTEETLCWRVDALRSSFRPRGLPQLQPFDTIFFDPPYRMIQDLHPGTPIFRSLHRLAKAGISAENALLVLRTPMSAEFECPPAWRLDRILDLKSMQIHLLEKRTDATETGKETGNETGESSFSPRPEFPEADPCRAAEIIE